MPRRASASSLRRSALLAWLPFAVIATIAAATVEVLVQQSYRTQAIDPQEECKMAEDLAGVLSVVRNPADVVQSSDADLAAMVLPIATVYDDRGAPVVSMATLDGKIPVPPAAALANARTHTEYRFVWEPRPDVRREAALVHYDGQAPGFVLVSRSLHEAQLRERALGAKVVEGWAVVMLGSVLVAGSGARARRKGRPARR